MFVQITCDLIKQHEILYLCTQASVLAAVRWAPCNRITTNICSVHCNHGFGFGHLRMVVIIVPISVYTRLNTSQTLAANNVSLNASLLLWREPMSLS